MSPRSHALSSAGRGISECTHGVCIQLEYPSLFRDSSLIVIPSGEAGPLCGPALQSRDLVFAFNSNPRSLHAGIDRLRRSMPLVGMTMPKSRIAGAPLLLAFERSGIPRDLGAPVLAGFARSGDFLLLSPRLEHRQIPASSSNLVVPNARFLQRAEGSPRNPLHLRGASRITLPHAASFS
jgi:hypothetical protein